MNRSPYNYYKDIKARAQELGYPGPLTAMWFLYHIEGLSLSQTGKALNISGAAVRNRLLDLEPALRARGGNNVNPGIFKTSQFRFECRGCGQEFYNPSWFELVKVMKGHRCK